LVTLFVVIALSLVVTRVATVALTLTGLSWQAARFQARSAFTGSGFTTAESEAVVGHPVRRRIVMQLMLLGNAGLVSAVGTLMLSLTGVQSTGQGLVRVAVLLVGLTVLVLLSRSRWVDRWMRRVIERSLRRHTDLDTRDYDELLHLSGEWRVVELKVEPDDWIAHRPLSQLDLPDEGVLVLGITRPGGRYIGAPTGETRLLPDDLVLLYGRSEALDELDGRPRGEHGDLASIEARAHYRRELEREQHPDSPDREDT
jgi:hypothetical protein